MSTSILVIGLGELGTAVVEALVKHPDRGSTAISVLLRQSAIDSQDATRKAARGKIESLGVTLVAGDVVHDSVSDLASTFAKYDTVIGCAGMGLPAGTQVRLARAAIEAGIHRYFPWQFGVDYDVIGEGSSQDLFDEQLQVRRLLRAQTAVDWVIVSVGLFMSFLFVPEFGIVDLAQRTVRALGSWDTKVTVTTPEDIALMTAEAVLRPEGISHQVVYIAGDTVTYGQVADLVTAKYGQDFKREVWGLGLIARELENDPTNSMLKYRGVFGAGRGVWWDTAQTLNAKRGIKLTSLEAYLRDMQ